MNNLQVIERNNERVLTTQQLADVYETDARNISNNFNNNKD
ncbi:ORF6N domain-containing protein, partial [Clostridioides difficile]